MSYKLTRIAPTPSGYLHLGNVFSFAITAAIARRLGASILLRIDDLDRDRVQREYVEDIFETLRFLEIPWDMGPRDFRDFERSFSQVHRLPLYHSALARLRSSCAVFGCSCSRAEILRLSPEGVYPGTCRERGLSLDAEGISWRLNSGSMAGSAGYGVPAGTDDLSGSAGFEVLAGSGDWSGSAGFGGSAGSAEPGPGVGPMRLRVKTYPEGVVEAGLPMEMRDFVVRKKDGFPAYQLSSVVDDLHYGVDLIVHGQDLWASTLAQLYLSYPLEVPAFREIGFYHHPLLTSPVGEKLSKSAGATSIQYLRRQGLTAADIYALIARAFAGADAASRADVAAPVRDWEGLADLVVARGDMA